MGNLQPSIDQAEHIGSGAGENIEAKRVGAYVWNGSGWQRMTQPGASGLIPGTDYDYIDGQQTSATVDTFVYKLGGSGGTTVRTIVVTYVDSTKADIDNIVYS